MIEFIKSLFSKSLVMPSIGDKFVLKNGDPFDEIMAEIIDMKEDWVKYGFIHESTLLSYYYTIRFKEFRKLYRPIK